MDVPELTLYFQPTCPFCIRVLRYMQQHGIEIPMKNIADSSEFRKDLLSIAGSSQTPCLVIDGKPMHESEDIIKWFKDYL